jgi:hypothetical protein
MAKLILNGSTSGSVTLESPAVSGTTTLTLPTTTGNVVADTATQTLTNKTLTSPILTTPNLGTPSALVLTNATGLSAAALPAGSILQVVQGAKTDAFTTTSTSFVIPSGLSAVITPSSSSNRILIMCYTNFAISGDSGHSYAQIQRDGTGINIGDAASSRPRAGVAQNNYGDASPPSFAMCFLDSPATTSAVTYSLGVRSSNGTTVYLNRSVRDADSGAYDGRTSSAIIVMEVKG